MGMKNGIPTLNVIPASRLSPITQYMQKFLPAPTNGGVVGNYLGGVPSGYDNWEFLSKVDYDITSAQRVSVVLTLGSRTNVPFTVGTNVPAPASTPGVVFLCLIPQADMQPSSRPSSTLSTPSLSNRIL